MEDPLNYNKATIISSLYHTISQVLTETTTETCISVSVPCFLFLYFYSSTFLEQFNWFWAYLCWVFSIINKRCSTDNSQSKNTTHEMGGNILRLHMVPDKLLHLRYFTSYTRSFCNFNFVLALGKRKWFARHSKCKVVCNISCWYHTSWCT